MDAPNPGDLNSPWVLLLVGVLIGLVGWIFKSDRDRTNRNVDKLYGRTDQHAQRLTALDGKTEQD